EGFWPPGRSRASRRMHRHHPPDPRRQGAPLMAISLSSISRTTRNSLPPRVVVHGDGGVGKSTFAAGAYKPVFLPFEDGLSGLEVDAFPLLRSYQDAIDALASLA